MKRSSLFGHVVELLGVIRGGQRPADAVVTEFFRSRRYLGARDRRFISDTVFGILRNFRLTEFHSREALKRAGNVPPAQDTPEIALVGAYCARIAGENPHSLLPDVSGLWRVYVPDVDCHAFLEALSTVSLPVEVANNAGEILALRFSFPGMIVNEWMERYGRTETELLCTSLNAPAPTTVRVNTLATTVEQCRAALLSEGIDVQRTSLSPVGLRLSKRINAQALRSFQQGFFEIQDEGSQLISLLTGATPGDTIIDACAGGGGKSLHLAAMMENRGTLLSIDVEEARLKNIRQRLTRAGVSIVQPCLANRDREAITQRAGKADAVLIDAPCSGIGTFRRNPGAKLMFRESIVDRMAAIQHDVVEEYSLLVRPGGRLVYSTCTLLERENEGQVQRFLLRHPEFELISASHVLSEHGVNMESSGDTLVLFPHKTTTDGFFAAVMTRRP